jgi:plastocyanin
MQFTVAVIALFAAMSTAAAVPTYQGDSYGYKPETITATVTSTCTTTTTSTCTTTTTSTCTTTETSTATVTEYKPTKTPSQEYGNYKRDDSYDASYQPTYYNVIVGGDGILAYNPPQVFAKVGDIIKFEFLQVNHTATTSEFNTPCIANGDFDTGFVPNPTGDRGMFREFHVKDTKPHWFYCRQTTHCGKGMVFAINPTPENTFEKFQAMAIAQGSAADAAAAAAAAAKNYDDYSDYSKDYNDDKYY